jgi:transcriptional regulator with XRE-family HTH domain
MSHISNFPSELQSICSLIAERLRARRKELKYRQEDLAEYGGPSKDTVIKWESGNKIESCEFGSFLRLCKSLECDAAYFFGDIDAPTKPIQDICDETGLTLQAYYNLAAAASREKNDFRPELLHSSNSELQSFNKATVSKIDFLNALLENDQQWEKIASYAFDYAYNKSSKDVNTVQYSEIALYNAARECMKLIEGMKWTYIKEIQQEENGKQKKKRRAKNGNNN